MKRFYLILASLCVVLWLASGCAVSEPEDTIPDPGPVVDGPEDPDTNDPNTKTPDDGIDDPEEDPEDPGEQEPVVDNRVVKLLINELRAVYSGTAKPPAAEFIEFKITSGGNMDGIKVFVAGNSADPLLYEFLPLIVEQGEYLVLHLRTLEGDLCKNEYGSALDESSARDSSPTARDFWIPGSKSLLRKTDIVYVLDRNNEVLDAVMMNEVPDKPWNKNLQAAAEFLFEQGAWNSASGDVPGPFDAVDTSAVKTAFTRSISRDEAKENSNSAADWFVTKLNHLTPGGQNVARETGEETGGGIDEEVEEEASEENDEETTD